MIIIPEVLLVLASGIESGKQYAKCVVCGSADIRRWSEDTDSVGWLIPNSVRVTFRVATAEYVGGFPSIVYKLARRFDPPESLAPEDSIAVLRARQLQTIEIDPPIRDLPNYSFITLRTPTIPATHIVRVDMLKPFVNQLAFVKDNNRRNEECPDPFIRKYHAAASASLQLPIGSYLPVTVVSGMHSSPAVLQISEWLDETHVSGTMFVADDSVRAEPGVRLIQKGTIQSGEHFNDEIGVVLQSELSVPRSPTVFSQ